MLFFKFFKRIDRKMTASWDFHIFYIKVINITVSWIFKMSIYELSQINMRNHFYIRAQKQRWQSYCIGHERPREVDNEWWWMYAKNSTCMLLRKFQREKTLGEMWAAVIRTINNLLRTVWLRRQAPGWRQSRSQLMLKGGPCWTYSRGATRRR